jgi:hypothetical protein
MAGTLQTPVCTLQTLADKPSGSSLRNRKPADKTDASGSSLRNRKPADKTDASGGSLRNRKPVDKSDASGSKMHTQRADNGTADATMRTRNHNMGDGTRRNRKRRSRPN